MRDIVIKKTIVLSAIAIMCLVVGLAYGVAAQDRILMIMSGIICTVNVYKIYELFQIFKKEKYTVLCGQCLETIYKPLGKYRIYRIWDGEDAIEISVPKNVKLKVNEEYKFYFKKNNLTADGYNDWIRNKILSESYIGYELINREAEE